MPYEIFRIVHLKFADFYNEFTASDFRIFDCGVVDSDVDSSALLLFSALTPCSIEIDTSFSRM